MNYLAHAALSGDDPELLLGNLMGDFVRGRDLSGYAEGVARGIRLHRRIDVYTDAHPVVLRSKQRVRPPGRRCAGIAVDLFYDHFLARHWCDYSPVPLTDFNARVYRLLAESEPLLPERMRPFAGRMIEQDWLGSYAEMGAICGVLARVGRRLKVPNTLGEAADDLSLEYARFEEDFRGFFPELAGFAAELGRTAAA